MNSQGVSVSMVYPIIKTIVHKGYDLDSFYRYASFDPASLRNVEARIPEQELERLTLAAAEYTQDPYFGLLQGQIMEFADMGILGYVMMHSSKVEDALAAYQRYNVILCIGFNLKWEVCGNDVLIRLSLQSPGRMSRHCIEDMACSLYRLIGKLSNRQPPLREIAFMHEAPEDLGPYEAAFGRSPVFGAKDDVLRLSKEVLDFPVMYSDAKLLRLFDSVAQETMEELLRPGKLSDQVVLWMKQCSPSFFPTLQETAAHFGFSTRSLQNKLKEEDTTYNEISVRVRKELAIGYLRKLDYSVSEIAYVLHFSEPSAFQSAFKKWTGITPGQYRTRLMENMQ
ncbi:AraC family transcriptional regulator [Paenibacillus silviterrae]|uniref:AraC family transcriptional regulator n=1 Tax=Paenibacillus silviterrae TaxID=3242194 RepID=UPI002543B0D0|nr:AraC family transcriptional regulator [Paenibacillus chinjuensis]